MEDERATILAAGRDLVANHLAALSRFPPSGRDRLRDVLDGLDRAFSDLTAVVGPADGAAPLADTAKFAAQLATGHAREFWSRALVAEAFASASGSAFAMRQALAAPALRDVGAPALDVAAAMVEVERARKALGDASYRALDALALWAGSRPSRDAPVAPLVAAALALGSVEAARGLVEAALARLGVADGPVARALAGVEDPVLLSRSALYADSLRARRPA